MPPYLRREPPWFVFLLHPRDRADLDKWAGASILRSLTGTDEEFERKALSTPPIVLGEFIFGSSPVRGELVAVPELGARMLRARGRAAVVDAARLAVERGTRVLGLGALTAPATRGGSSLLPHVGDAVTITTGNALTAAVARRNVHEAVEWLGLSRPARVAIVGATGSVGAAAARLLAGDGLGLVLLGRTAERTQRLLPDLVGRARCSGDLSDIAGCDVVLLLTSDPSARLKPELFECRRDPTIVIDVAQPPNVPVDEYPAFRAAEIVVTGGGLVRVPGLFVTQDIGTPPDATFACLAETYLFAREGIRRHSVGAASPELAQMLERVATRHGVTPRPLELDLLAAEPAGAAW